MSNEHVTYSTMKLLYKKYLFVLSVEIKVPLSMVYNTINLHIKYLGKKLLKFVI